MNNRQGIRALPYLLPALILMLIFVFNPIISTLILSFTQPGESEVISIDNYEYVIGLKSLGIVLKNTLTYTVFVALFEKILIFTELVESGVYGFANYEYVIGLKSFGVGLKNTLTYTVFVTLFEMIIALSVSYALTKVVKFKTTFQTTYFLPYVTSVIAIGTVFKVMFNSDFGIVNQLFGLNIVWLGAEYAIVSMIILGVWKGLAFNILIVFTGLSTIDTNLEKAAQVDGFSSLKTFIKIKLPQIKGILAYLLTINIIFNIKVYEEAVSLFGTVQPGPGGSANTVVYELYSKMTSDPKAAAAIAVILLVIVLLIRTVLQFIGGRK